MIPFSALSLLFIVLISISTSYGLECYVCNNQEDNSEKCVKTIKTCEQGEDVCLTEISWGSMPYWSQGALKQFYISKRCSAKDYCEKFRSDNMPLCTHIWYEDWKCSECCKGDRCNYYVISGTNKISMSTTLTLSTLLVSIVYFY